MNINKIRFSNYKIFEKEQLLELKPITILIGKNSSGKSSLLKLPLLIFNSFSNSNDDSLINLKLAGLDLGYEFKDLLYNKYETRILRFEIKFEDKKSIGTLRLGIQNIPEKDIQVITEFQLITDSTNMEIKGEFDDQDNILYNGSVNNVKIENSTIEFKDLLPFKWNIGDIEIKNTIDYINLEYRPLFESFIKKVKYLLPFRAFPKRLYDDIDINSFTHDFSGGNIPLTLLNDSSLLKKVSDWYSSNLNIEKIEIEKIDRRGRHFEVNVFQNFSKGIPINLFDVGQGVSQSLPIVTRSFMDREDVLEIIEQPELHLHPAAHSDIASLLVDSALRNPSSKYLIETHSENFILRIRRMIAEGKIQHDFVNIYWIDNDSSSSSLEKIEIDEKGEVSFWPDGIFSEAFEEVKAIRRAQRDKS